MRPDDVSRTARLVAAARAIATARGICDDPFARELAGEEALAHAGSIPELIGGIAMRTRYIDDVLRLFATAEERAQVVILGAGLDTRASRLGLADRATFFEIDLPGMLAYKAERLGPRPQVVSMAHDLASGPWLPVLSAHPRFDASAPTCVIALRATDHRPARSRALSGGRDLLPLRGGGARDPSRRSPRSRA
jgi:methyltransferase (TIGR00027 family)